MAQILSREKELSEKKTKEAESWGEGAFFASERRAF